MIQIAFVKWGTAYDHRHINGMVDEIRKYTDEDLRVVVVTDDASGLYDEFHIHPFPELGLPFEQLTQRSCYAKLSIFVPIILETGIRTLFFDLDTAVFGYVTALTDCLDDHRRIYLLPNQFIQFWQLRPVLRHVAPRSFYFANSSTIAFYPEDDTFIAAEFRENMARWLADPKAKGRPVLTFMDFYAKPEKIVAYETGEIIRAGPLVTRWNWPSIGNAFWIGRQSAD